MKTQRLSANAKNPESLLRNRGFALMVTILMMVLMTVVGVGLLSLSTISLRSAGAETDLRIAKQNARLALILAIGQLQRTTGSDRAITAPATAIAADSPHGVTGVWEPWREGEALTRAGIDSATRFRSWLLSSDDSIPAGHGLRQPSLMGPGAAGATPLIGSGSLGTTSDAGQQSISVKSTPVQVSGTSGALAWSSTDESMKAHIDPPSPTENQSHALAMIAAAGAPAQDGIGTLPGLSTVELVPEDSGRLITIGNGALVQGSGTRALQESQTNLTVQSRSLLTNPVLGGFKQDLSLMFSNPSQIDDNQRLYQSAGLPTGPSDPLVSMLASYHNLYLDPRTSGAGNPIAAALPDSYSPTRFDARTRTDTATPVTPKSPLLIPTVLRVDTIFSLVVRDVHGERAGNLRANGRNYMLHLLYLPVVTLHNPFSIPLRLDGMRVNFQDVPVGFQILIDNQPITSSLVPLNQMYVNSEGSASATKSFSVKLRQNVGTSAARPMVLEPGQTKIFGTPNVAPSWRWIDESPGTGSDGNALFDWRNDKTADFELAPKLMTDPLSGGGFDIDWLAPRSLQTTVGSSTYCFGEGIIALRGTESIGIKFGPVALPTASGTFGISTELQSRSRFTKSGAFTVKYSDLRSLKRFVETGTSQRYPEARVFPEDFPKRSVDPPLRAADLYERNTTEIRNYVRAKPFLLFSVGSKTAMESFVPTKILTAGNPVMNLAQIDLARNGDPLGSQPIEMVMMPIRNGIAAIEERRESEEAFSFTGNGSLRGTSRATIYEIPEMPLQSVAQLRHANLAGSGFMPRTTYTVGESFASPALESSTVDAKWADGTQMLDHTFLANEALWDHAFFSTIAPQPAGYQNAGATDLENVATRFFNGESKLPNPRVVPLVGKSESAAAVASVSTSDGPLSIASKIALVGGFNVNSTSTAAWTAILSSLRGKDIHTSDGTDPGVETFSAIPRMRSPSTAGIDDAPILTREQRWQGYRRLSDQAIEELAASISSEIRAHGPFLSLGEFVNREIGADSQPSSLAGVIQRAIDRTEINDLAKVDGIELDDTNLGGLDLGSVAAGSGNSAIGSPAFVSQGDVLSLIGSRITVRGDTFRIRAYGESTDAKGFPLARAWCEAIVQRGSEFVDSTNPPDTEIDQLTPVNRAFGRRYEISHFRWLKESEV